MTTPHDPQRDSFDGDLKKPEFEHIEEFDHQVGPITSEYHRRHLNKAFFLPPD